MFYNHCQPRASFKCCSVAMWMDIMYNSLLNLSPSIFNVEIFLPVNLNFPTIDTNYSQLYQRFLFNFKLDRKFEMKRTKLVLTLTVNCTFLPATKIISTSQSVLQEKSDNFQPQFPIYFSR